MDKKIKILHLEDSLNDFELLHSLIESGKIEHDYFLTDNEKDFVNILNTENIDIILSDYNLPDYSGNEALKFARELFPFIPFIFVSGTMGEDAAINAMLNGATDYVLKNKLERLIPAIKRALNEKEHSIDKDIAEKSLHESEEKFQLIMENSADAIFIVNQQGKYMYTNKAVTVMLGYTLEEMKSKTIADISPKNRIEKYYEMFKRILNGDKVFTEIELLKKDSTYISTDLNAVMLPDGQIYASCRDITERKNAEELLKKSELLLLSSMDSQKDMIIFSIDKYYRYLYFNKAYQDIMKFAYNIDIKIGMNSLDCITLDNDRLEAKNNYDRALRGESHSNVKIYGNVNRAYFESFFNPIRDAKNEIFGATGFARDVTQHKQAELELIKAKDQAEESDRLKSAFLTNMSHEIRTPMNGILGFTELLKEPNLTSVELQDYVQTIQISGARMLNTINSIVDISKIESGLVKIDIKEANLNDKIEFTYKFFRPEVESKGLKFSFKTSLSSKESIIKTDHEKVYGILINLVRNAIKFTFYGSIEFGYVLKSNSEPGSTEQSRSAELEFFIKDTGIGIPQEQQQLIFERFRQGSESHNRGYEGSGLGLSISKSYVEMLGGKIRVESEEGKGSTFYFTIPYNPVLEKETKRINIISSKQQEVHLKDLKILIVEDDEISYSLLSITLQKISKEVLRAITGVEAIVACRNNPDLDLVLMDIRMPKMDGNEATRQIRQFNKDVIIIAQTAFAFPGDKEMAIEAGCNDYISKPISNASLIALILRYFNK